MYVWYILFVWFFPCMRYWLCDVIKYVDEDVDANLLNFKKNSQRVINDDI